MWVIPTKKSEELLQLPQFFVFTIFTAQIAFAGLLTSKNKRKESMSKAVVYSLFRIRNTILSTEAEMFFC
jgi:hypothetical protein